MNAWNRVLELDQHRQVVAGDAANLAAAIGRGADLRVRTAFRHNEHIDVTSDNPELIEEAMDFRVTYLLDDRWTAAVLNLRQPVELPHSFMDRVSMSFFMYNQDGTQAIARPFIDGPPAVGELGASTPETPPNMPKYHTEDSWDATTNAPSSNFVYDFEYFRFYVRDDWHEVLSHDADGTVRSGSIADLAAASRDGLEIKVAVSGLASDLCANGDADEPAVPHEVFVHAGSCYYYTDRQLFITGTQPVVRIKPLIPLRYTSQGWDFGWLFARSDGHVVYRRCDPYTLKFTDVTVRHPLRWFAR